MYLLIVYLLSIICFVFAQYDIPEPVDFAAPYRPVSYSCFKKNPDCLLLGIEQSECARNGGLVGDCRDIKNSVDCQSCFVEDVEVYRYVAVTAVQEWCVKNGGSTDKFKLSPICAH